MSPLALLCSLLAGLFSPRVVVLAAYIEANWTYRLDTSPTCVGTMEDPCGPEYWANIEPQCNSALLQGPANLEDVVIVTDAEIPHYSYTLDGCVNWRQGAGTSSFEVEFPECRNLSVSYHGRTFYLESMHFHSPSEHSIGGGFYDAEAHMLHFSEDRELFLVGVFLHTSSSNLPRTNNSLLDSLWKNGGSTVTEISQEKDVSDPSHPLKPYREFFPPTKSYFAYEGSLTTPPCTPADWIVYETPIIVSIDDLNILRGTVVQVPGNKLAQDGNNNLPIQPVNGRTMTYVPSDASLFPTGSGASGLSSIEEGFLAFAVASAFVLWILLIALGVFLFRNRGLFLNRATASMNAAISNHRKSDAF